MKKTAIVLALTLAPISAFADETKQETQQEEAGEASAETHATRAPPRPPSTVVVKADAASPEYVPPRFTPYQGGRIPAGAQLTTTPNMGLVVSGVTIAGTAYLGSLIYAISTCSAQMECRGGSGFLYIPVIGPILTAATAPTTGGAALAAFDGGLQLLGAGLAFAGVLFPKKLVMWQDSSNTAKLSVTPSASGAGVALTLTHL